MDLIGLPWQVIVGPKSTRRGQGRDQEPPHRRARDGRPRGGDRQARRGGVRSARCQSGECALALCDAPWPRHARACPGHPRRGASQTPRFIRAAAGPTAVPRPTRRHGRAPHKPGMTRYTAPADVDGAVTASALDAAAAPRAGRRDAAVLRLRMADRAPLPARPAHAALDLGHRRLLVRSASCSASRR